MYIPCFVKDNLASLLMFIVNTHTHHTNVYVLHDVFFIFIIDFITSYMIVGVGVRYIAVVYNSAPNSFQIDGII